MLQEGRIHDLMNMSDELVRENYHGKDRVTQRKEEVLQCWQELLQLLDKHKTNLTMLCGLMAMLREVDTVLATIAELQVGTSNLRTYRLLRETFTSTRLH
jgi:spectrin beta